MTTAFIRNTTEGDQVTVFDSFSIKDALKARGYKFGELPHPVEANGTYEYGKVDKGWYCAPGIDRDAEIEFLTGLQVKVVEITLDSIGRIATSQQIN